jgi:peroxiredoxin
MNTHRHLAVVPQPTSTSHKEQSLAWSPASREPTHRTPILGCPRDADKTKQLAPRLCGQQLPDIDLVASDGTDVPLNDYASGRAIVYFVPGQANGARTVNGILTRDAAQHRGYVRLASDFERVRAKVFCVGSQPRNDLTRVGLGVRAEHFMFSDPALALAGALGLPTDPPDATQEERYRRTVLIARDGLIEAVFGPLSDSDAAGSAQQALNWLILAG